MKTEKNLLTPRYFDAPAQRVLYRNYGDPGTKGWQSEWLELWDIQDDFPWFPAETISIHRDFIPLLDNAFSQLELKGLHKEIRTFDGCFGIRNVHGGSALLSTHSWGVTIDMNLADNLIGTNGTWTEEFLKIMRLNGIYCGSDWNGLKAPMHFSMVNG